MKTTIHRNYNRVQSPWNRDLICTKKTLQFSLPHRIEFPGKLWRHGFNIVRGVAKGAGHAHGCSLMQRNINNNNNFINS